MTNEVFQQAIEETVGEVENLGYERHFSSLLSRAISMHNQGIYFNFTFGVLNDKTGFSHFAKRYGLNLDVMDGFVERKIEDRRLRLMRAADRIKKKWDKIRDEQNDWKKMIRMVEERQLHAQEATPSNETYVSFLSRIKTVYEKELSQVKVRYDVAQMAQSAISRMQSHVRSLGLTMASAERLYMKWALDRFLEKVVSQAGQLFPGAGVRVVYHEKDIMKRYDEACRERRYDNYADRSRCFFLNQMIGFLRDVRDHIEIHVMTSERTYVLKGNAYYFTLTTPPVWRTQRNAAPSSAKQQLKDFLVRHPELAFTLSELATVNHTFGERHPVIGGLSEVLMTSCSEKVIRECAMLQQLVQVEEEERMASQPTEIRDEALMAAFVAQFPDLTVVQDSVEDFAWNIMMPHQYGQEKRYNTVIRRVLHGDTLLGYYSKEERPEEE